MNDPRALAFLRSRSQAKALLHPMRLEILRHAREPRSATAIAQRLGLPRQRVNYHVGQLAKAGLLRPAGRRRRRNLTEQRYVATARSYVLSPEILGPLQADAQTVTETVSASRLMALGSQIVSDLGRVSAEAARAQKSVATFSMDVAVNFTDPARRATFARELRDAIADVASKYGAPDEASADRGPQGRPFRLVVGCYPVPAASNAEEVAGERAETEA